MLDTIRIKFPIEPTADQLKEGWIQKTTTSQSGISNVYFYNPIVGETTLRFTYRPVDYTGNPLLTLECSLPKLIFDNNYQMIQSTDGAIKIANLLLADVPHIPKLDLGEGNLIRLDLCYNHQVGDAVNDYIVAIGNLDYPHRRTKYHRYEGAEFRAKHKTTKFYNKEHESGYIEAHGILRQEITLINGKDIQKLLHTPRPTLLDVTPELAKEELQSDLEKLGLLNNSIGNRDTTLETLCNKYGESAGIYFAGLLSTKAKYSRREIKKITNMHPRSLDRKLQKIRDAGIPLTLTEREEPLPPLSISF